MRSDMTKVLVERPRGGAGRGGKGSEKEHDRTPPEEWRTREGIRRRWLGSPKYFRDHLGPIRRFLASNVGRPWDLVYSEICAETRQGFPVREHFLIHVYQFVERSVILVDGVPCHQGGGAQHGTPLKNYGGRYLYVCPRTGLLRRIPDQRKKPR